MASVSGPGSSSPKHSIRRTTKSPLIVVKAIMSLRSAQKGGGDLPFIVSTIYSDGTKHDANMRKLIRSHVMRGKNRKKSPQAKNVPGIDLDLLHACLVPATGSNQHGNDPLAPACFPLPDNIEPSEMAILAAFRHARSQISFPLESCLADDALDSFCPYFGSVTSEPLYHHGLIFSAQSSLQLMLRGNRTYVVEEVSPHYVKTLEHLLEVLKSRLNDDSIIMLTSFVVLKLAVMTYMRGDLETGAYHMQGLRRIVDLGGGVHGFRGPLKILLDILRWDIRVSIECNTETVFFNDPPAQPYIPYPLEALGLRPEDLDAALPRPLEDIDAELRRCWNVTRRFCLVADVAAASDNRRIALSTWHDIIGSTMFRLLRMSFGPSALDEAVRLCLLAFSSKIFLHWAGLRLSPPGFRTAFADSLSKTDFSKPGFSKFVLWMLLIGSFSVFEEQADAWLKPWLRVHLELREFQSWSEVRDMLKSDFLWIASVQDEAGKALFESVISSPQ
ncbi:hypothetical protein F4778DRAFT_722452 [Xylariomycetidae sp. FL2044]|nr:hypothetical protein F4778DRAFT_722452 [Xylariomycetidae sp. FL2044]